MNPIINIKLQIPMRKADTFVYNEIQFVVNYALSSGAVKVQFTGNPTVQSTLQYRVIYKMRLNKSPTSPTRCSHSAIYK